MASTIVAQATGPAEGGVGIVRLSGPDALALGRQVTVGLPEQVQPRHAYLVSFVEAPGGAVLDQGLLLYFGAPRSFTGEDVVELHAHGSPRLLQLLVRALLERGAVLAQPGEFSQRAFLNGRLDLARAEAVADLVSAQSEAAVRAAAAQLGGALSARLRALREPLLALRADVEGVLNFPDEAEGADAELGARLAPLREQAQALLREAGRGRLVRRGAKVVLYGPVNAGKSTLFNRLVGDERAIVDEEPGTTRDVLEARVEWDGLGVTLVDTAGLRPSPGRIEALGIARAQRALEEADLAVLVLGPEAETEEASWREVARGPVVRVRSKADLRASAGDDSRASSVSGASGEDLEGLRASAGDESGAISVSGVTGLGVEGLRALLLRRLWGEGAAAGAAFVSERHADALRRSCEALDRAVTASEHSTVEVVSGELGLALEALGEITGESASEELLEQIFRRFCIGK